MQLIVRALNTFLEELIFLLIMIFSKNSLQNYPRLARMDA